MKKIFAIILIVCCLWTVDVEAALSLDGNGDNPTPVALTTTNANDVIILMAECTAGCTMGTPSDTAGLTWNLRGAATPGSSGISVAIYWAYAASPLTGDSIAVPSSNRLIAFGIAGANTSTPFDTNAVLPLIHGVSGGTTSSVSMSTSNANDFLFCFVRSNGAYGTLTAPTGYSNITNSSGVESADYQIVSATQSSIATQYSWTNSVPLQQMCDAVCAAGTCIAATPENALMAIP